MNKENQDELAWLEDIQNPKTKEVIKTENDLYKKYFADKEQKVEILYEEIKSRIKLDDSTLPWQLDNNQYYWRYDAESSYGIFCRNQGNNSKEEILLDENKLAIQSNFFSLGSYTISPCQKYLAYTADFKGDERYVLYIKNLDTNNLLIDRIIDVGTSIAFNKDSSCIYYVKLDKEHRPYACFCHKIGKIPTKDKMIFLERDARFFVDVELSKSEKYIFITTESKLSNATLFLPSDRENHNLQCINEKKENVRYYVEHASDRFFILSNENAKQFALWQTEENNFTKDNWRIVLPERKDITLENIEGFNNYLVVSIRGQAITKLLVINLHNLTDLWEIEFNEEVYHLSTVDNNDARSETLRFCYETLNVPSTIYDYDLKTKQKELKKQTPVLGAFLSTDYQSERIFAQANDGTYIPISLVYNRKYPPNSERPLLLYGYGAYGIANDVWFSHARLSLLDNGVTFAIAHIRGGGDCGEKWHDAGKLAVKENTFSDFAACAHMLCQNKLTCKEKLSIKGGSAGGLLVGAVLNKYPEICNFAIADVPFVDVLNTMQNENLPLTITEYEEWGNPNIQNEYNWIANYSPYENIQNQYYPNIFITCGLNDCRVPYWEAIKWGMKIRKYAVNSPNILIKINEYAGHGGASGRFAVYKDIAEEYVCLFENLMPTCEKNVKNI